MRLTRINRTGEPQIIPASDGRLGISIPIRIQRRSGRKLVILPRGAEQPTATNRRASVRRLKALVLSPAPAIAIWDAMPFGRLKATGERSRFSPRRHTRRMKSP